MYKPVKLAINFDEISDNFQEAAEIMHDMEIEYGELRTINKKNFVYWANEEIDEFKLSVNKTGIQILAAATPLFKWYSTPNDTEVRHDNFGFNPRLSEIEKRETILRTLETASSLKISRLRIFSELNSSNNSSDNFASNNLLSFALIEASKRDIDLLIENEPVCRIHTKAALVDFLEENQSPNLKLWLDIANLYEIGETIDEAFLTKVGPRIGYIHVKNYILNDGIRHYTPAGDGLINYKTVLPLVLSYSPEGTVVSVETHTHEAEKVSASRSSLLFLKTLFSKLQEVDNE